MSAFTPLCGNGRSLLLDCSDFNIYIYLKKLPACSSFSCVARETSCLKKLQTDSDRLDLQPSVEDDRGKYRGKCRGKYKGFGVILPASCHYIYSCNKLHATTDCKFRTYCSEQSMFVRQWQAEHCLTEGSLRSLSRTVQLISERKSSSERFFEVLFCRYKKVPKSLDCFGGKCRGKYIGYKVILPKYCLHEEWNDEAIKKGK